LTGTDFSQWAERLRTAQGLVDDPNLRQQLNNALGRAQDLRRDYLNHANAPKWGDVNDNVLTPLTKVRAELGKELARRTQPDSLQPVDRDPVPEKYADSVQHYYEALGN
jgi:hypothetical protein